MRVLFCSQAAHTGGGVEAWLEAVSSALIRRGHDVITGLAKGDFHDPRRYSSKQVVINPVAIDGREGYRESRVTSLLHLIRRIEPDIVVPVHLEDALLATAFEKTRGRVLRLVICIHGQAPERVKQVSDLGPFIDFAVGVSRRTVAMLGEVLPDERIAHIPTGVPEPLKVPWVRTSIRSVAYVGRLDDRDKRVIDLITFANAHPEMEIHVAGAGPDENRLREGLPRGIFHGTLSRSELYERIYPAVDGLLLFSPAEAGPIVAWEAMIHGVVPIVSDYCGRAEENVLRDGETAIVFPVGDIQEAVRKIRVADVEALSRNAPRLLPDKYRIASFGESWDRSLTRCLSMESRVGSPSLLPSLVSPGRLSLLSIGVESMALLRRTLRKRYVHKDPGSEWPH